MTYPTELCSDDEGFNTKYFTSLQQLCIGYLILPFDAGYVQNKCVNDISILTDAARRSEPMSSLHTSLNCDVFT